ncbi:MAG: porin [Gallionella sp.]
MKKKIITLAVAAALAPAAAFADVTVYGQAHMSLDSHSGNGGTTATGTQDGMQLTSNSSRLGFKGTINLDGGMKALYQYEASVALDGSGNGTIFNGTRDSYLGLAGGFGTVMTGRLPLANQYVYDVNYFADQVGDAGNFAIVGNATGGRISRALAYATPDMGGFSGLVAFVPNTQESVTGVQAAPNKQSSYTLRGTYGAGPVFAAVSYQSIGVAGAQDAKLTVTSLAATFDFGAGNAGVQYTRNGANSQATGGASTTQNVITAGVSFKVSDGNSVKAQYSKAAESVSNAKDGGSMIAVGFDHNLSKSTTVYVAFAKVTNDTGAGFSASGWGHGGVGGPAVPGNDPSAVSFGAVYKF